MKKKQNKNNIFVDTNVLIGYFTNNETDIAALKYLFSLNGKQLFVSALSIAQMVALFQNKKIKTYEEIKDIVVKIQHRFSVLSFTDTEITNSLSIENADIEDNMQYAIGQKMHCYYYVTNNTKDFNFYNIQSLSPQKVKIIPR